jgi:hypothetical protein
MNNARFVDEPTDMDPWGNALYMKPTDRTKAVVDEKTLWPDIGYSLPQGKAGTMEKLDSKHYDLQIVNTSNEYIYAKDILSLTADDAKKGESNTIYIDAEYEPWKIARFYRDVLKHNQDNFMIGISDGKKFVYDTIHEAAVELRKNRRELLYDYTEAMKFISRDVCSAEAFFQGILGASVFRDKEYVCNQSDYDPTLIEKEYHGVTTALFDGGSIQGLIKSDNTSKPSGLMTGPGDFSSILETMPITAFIQERRVAAENYIKEASKMEQAMSFSSPASRGLTM